MSASIAYYVSETTLDFSIEYISFVFCVDKEQFYSDKAEGFSDKVHRSRGAVFGKTAQIFSVSLSSPIEVLFYKSTLLDPLISSILFLGGSLR